MEQKDYRQVVATELKEDEASLAAVFDKVVDEYDAYKQSIAEYISAANKDLGALKEDELGRRALELAMVCVAAKKDLGMFDAVYALFSNPVCGELYEDKSWLVREGHRILGSLCTDEQLPKIAALMQNEALKTPMREQGLVTLHFVWFEKTVTEKILVEQYRKLLVEGLPGITEWEFLGAFAMNGAIIGGQKLRNEVMELINSGKLGEQTQFMRKLVQRLMTHGDMQFRQLMENDHKGFFTTGEAFKKDYYAKPADEDLKMPERGKTFVREEPKIGRNDPCPCGSGKKYKKCCGANL